MSIDLIKQFAVFIILLLVQGLVFNHIHLFGCATPLLGVILVLHFRRNQPRWSALLWSFCLGIGLDVFANTPGVTAATMTLLGFIQPYLFELFVPRDSAEDLEPSPRTIGLNSFFLYTLILVVLYCLLYFTLESFNFFNWLLWLECVGASALLTVLLVLALENFRK